MTLPPATFPWQPMPPDLTLVPNHVHLFLTSTDLPAQSIAALEPMLPADERERFVQYRMPKKRSEAVIARALLRGRLSHFLKISPQQVPLAVNPHGKPHLPDDTIHFNLSHTAGYVLLAVSDHELGVDIESPRDNLAHEDLARRFFTPAEHAALIALPQADRALAFFRCWTRKEALLKAVGRGIAAGLDTFAVPVEPSSSPLAVDRWTLHDLPVPATHIASLATSSPHPHLHYWSCPQIARKV
jgi:4'-phosphopantetheinyl transferase